VADSLQKKREFSLKQKIWPCFSTNHLLHKCLDTLPCNLENNVAQKWLHMTPKHTRKKTLLDGNYSAASVHGIQFTSVKAECESEERATVLHKPAPVLWFVPKLHLPRVQSEASASSLQFLALFPFSWGIILFDQAYTFLQHPSSSWRKPLKQNMHFSSSTSSSQTNHNTSHHLPLLVYS
jgi:hypothetical protein